MSASADCWSVAHKASTGTSGIRAAAFALIASMASSPQALALKIPIQASLNGGGEGSFEQQSRQGAYGMREWAHKF